MASVAVGVGVGDTVGGIGVASSGRRQAESNASSSKPHNMTLAFIAVLFTEGPARSLRWLRFVPGRNPALGESDALSHRVSADGFPFELFYISLPCLASEVQQFTIWREILAPQPCEGSLSCWGGIFRRLRSHR